MKRRVIARAGLFVSVVVALVAMASILAAFSSERAIALGIACGGGISLLCALTWIVGAIFTFDHSFQRLLRATLGLAPVRIAFAVAAVALLVVKARSSVDTMSLALSFAATHVLLLLAEIDCFAKLAEAASPYPKARSIRWGGLRLF